MQKNRRQKYAGDSFAVSIFLPKIFLPPTCIGQVFPGRLAVPARPGGDRGRFADRSRKGRSCGQEVRAASRLRRDARDPTDANGSPKWRNLVGSFTRVKSSPKHLWRPSYRCRGLEFQQLILVRPRSARMARITRGRLETSSLIHEIRSIRSPNDRSECSCRKIGGRKMPATALQSPFFCQRSFCRNFQRLSGSWFRLSNLASQ